MYPMDFAEAAEQFSAKFVTGLCGESGLKLHFGVKGIIYTSGDGFHISYASTVV
jgi:hypothetical protein